MKLSIACLGLASVLVLLLGTHGEPGRELTIAIVDTDIVPMFAVTGGVYVATASVELPYGSDTNQLIVGWVGPTVLLTCNTGTNTKSLMESSNLLDWTDTLIQVRGEGVEIPQPYLENENRFYRLQ